jgi:hypothetical protein
MSIELQEEIDRMLQDDLSCMRTELIQHDPLMVYNSAYSAIILPEMIAFLPQYIELFMDIEVHIPSVYAGLLDAYERNQFHLTDAQWTILYNSFVKMVPRIGEEGLDGKGICGRYTNSLRNWFFIEL